MYFYFLSLLLKQSQNKEGQKFVWAAPKMVSFLQLAAFCFVFTCILQYFKFWCGFQLSYRRKVSWTELASLNCTDYILESSYPRCAIRTVGRSFWIRNDPFSDMFITLQSDKDDCWISNLAQIPKLRLWNCLGMNFKR